MKKQEVVVYVSNNCDDCEKVLTFLDRLGVQFQLKNVTDNQDYMRDLQKQKIYATPVVFIDDLSILGFQEERIMQVLGLGSTSYGVR
ncbi:glutaredoxin family protein [Aquibacillus rhizosphaerae]|uniref:Glutaredoxin family protein n=1 Tax=Aquibacillus rhizosphaerae TaxID=3051431 RepID=A0ABT7L2Q8_9BACI|nr:glutaredoxin family protein [Aquibacillus sp. LR5S19]MDL4840143.1 glutaredoxin family protein [Aquibacillus sp. LR5S19]